MDRQQSGNGGALSMVPSFKEWPIVFIHHCPIEASVCHICTNEAARKPLFIIVARIQRKKMKTERKKEKPRNLANNQNTKIFSAIFSNISHQVASKFPFVHVAHRNCSNTTMPPKDR